LERTGKGLRLIGGHRPQVLQITLVSDQHDHNVRVGMISELLQPAGDVDVGSMLCNVVDEESANSTAVVAVAQV